MGRFPQHFHEIRGIERGVYEALLAFKIWTVTRRSAQYRSNNILTPVLRVIIESGAIYSMTVTAALISFVVKSNGVYVLLDMVRTPHFLHSHLAPPLTSILPRFAPSTSPPLINLTPYPP